MISINLEEPPPKSNDQYLQSNNNKNNDPKQLTSTDSIKEIKLILNPSTTYEIKHLQEHKSIKNKSNMPTKNMILLKPFIITILTCYSKHFSICYCTLGYSFVIFCGEICTDSLIVLIFELWDESLSDEKK